MTDFTLEDLSTRLDTVTNDMTTFTGQIRAWSAGTPTGGTGSDGTGTGGYYPVSDGLTTRYLPCPAYLISILAVGATGANASQDVAFDQVGTFGPSEGMGAFIVPIATTYDPTHSVAKCKVAPTASFTITINKNGSAWGTIVFGASSTTGTITIGSPTASAGDLIEYLAPATPDATFTHFIHTLRGT